jgi:hypothetical protein
MRMTLDTLIMLAGALVALLPFLGFPDWVDTWIFFALGIAVIALGIAVRRRIHKSTDAPTPLHFDDIRSR